MLIPVRKPFEQAGDEESFLLLCEIGHREGAEGN